MITIKFSDESAARIKKFLNADRSDYIRQAITISLQRMSQRMRGIAEGITWPPPPPDADDVYEWGIDPGGYVSMGMDSLGSQLNMSVTRRHSVTKAKMLEAVLTEIPLPQQIREIDITSEENAVRFTWRDQRFRVQDQLVEEIVEGMRSGSNTAILLSALIKRR